MQSLHSQIIESLKSEEYIDRMAQLFGEDLTTLSFWGTEPLLTTSLICPAFSKLVAVFPKLKEVSFSTSMPSPGPLVELIKEASLHNLKVSVQVSLDGPAFITDKNRFEGASEVIPRNFFEVLSRIQDTKSPVNFHWKATTSINNIKEMVKDPSKFDACIDYFNSLNEKFLKLNRNSLVTLTDRKYLPTLVVPGKYSSDDGKYFAEFLRNLRWKKNPSAYTARMERLISSWDELGPRRMMFTCSGGDSNIGLGRNLHICHRSFYFDEEAYVDDVIKTGIENWDISHFEQGTISMVRKYFIVDPTNDYEVTRFTYALRSYHDFWRMKIGYDVAMLKELALVGQASRIYLHNEELVELFSLFIESGICCPMENILNTGSTHLTPLSLLRMFGNGAFEEILEDVRR